jgi:NAD(P)-dependent dehydrogenase (short-subunit alcohol dehydrogenase family)
MTPQSPEGAARTPKSWFVTGASRGLGRAFVEAALAAGDRVAATTRRAATLDDLAAQHGEAFAELTLDVRDRAAVFAAVEQARTQFGRLDVVVNNAGTSILGMVEEISEAQAREHIETNFFGALWVSQAAMAVVRAQRAGHIVQISSIAAYGGHPTTGLYGAGKWALEGMSEALAKEAAAFGGAVTIVEPGGYETGLFSAGLTVADRLDGYAELHAQLEEAWSEAVDADPALAAQALLTLVDSDAPPLRLVLGAAVYDAIPEIVAARAAELEAWREISRAAG